MTQNQYTRAGDTTTGPGIAIMIGKVSGYELTTRSVLLIEGQAVRDQGQRIIADFRNHRHRVTANYEGDRAQVMKPIADAFLASLRFEGDK